MSEQVADRLEEAAGPAARFLEVGAGTGRIALPLHRRGRRVVGVDLSIPMLERYRAKAAVAGLPPPPVLRGDATRLPVRDASVDAVIEVHVLHLIPEWRQAMAEIRRVLAPGGVVLAGRRLWERSEGRGPRARARERLRAALSELGVTVGRVGARSDQEVLAAFIQLGGRIDELEPVSWREEDTLARHLGLLEERVYSESWEVPDGLWREAVRRVRRQLAEEGMDLDARTSTDRHVDIAAITFD